MADDVAAFMATMVMLPQPLPLTRAATVVRENYGLEARVARLTGERDENFRATAADGSEYVLKVAHPAEDSGVTALTTAALLHLASQDPGLPCPRVVAAQDGHNHVHFIDDLGTQRTARLLTYLPGRPLGRSHHSASLRSECGRLGGRLILALRTFRHPAAHRAHVPDDRTMRGRMSECAQREDETPTKPPALAAQRPRMMTAPERAAGKIGEKARGARGTGVIDEANLDVSVPVAQNARTGERRVVALEVQERRVDQVVDLGALGRVSDFQYEFASVYGADSEVLITLAREPHGACLEAVALAHQADCARK